MRATAITATHCNTLQHIATHCVCAQAVIADRHRDTPGRCGYPDLRMSYECIVVCCNVLQCVAVCCSVLQCVAATLIQECVMSVL